MTNTEQYLEEFNAFYKKHIESSCSSGETYHATKAFFADALEQQRQEMIEMVQELKKEAYDNPYFDIHHQEWYQQALTAVLAKLKEKK